MHSKLLRRAKRPFANFAERLMALSKTSSHESVYFYTFHKCASSLFSGYVLKNIEGLRNVNYAGQIYRGKNLKKLEFEDTGYVYGPIRLSVDRMSPVYKWLVEPVSSQEFITDKIAMFLVRDPRDILVSAYYSFGYTHGFSKLKEIRERQRIIRNEIQARTVDEYALDSADVIVRNFETVNMLSGSCKRSAVLKYETMIGNFDDFIGQFTKYVDIDPSVIRQIFARSRPTAKVDKFSHRRSGQPGGFRSALKEDTVAALNRKFEGVLARFQYEA